MTRNTSGKSCARSYRTLRDGSFEGRFPRHFVPGNDRCPPTGGVADISRQHLAKACCQMSRRDGAIVAWHEVPGTAPPQKSRPVGYGVIRAGVRADSMILASSPERLRVLIATRNVGLLVNRAGLHISKQRARQSRPTDHWSFMPDS